uniref:Uncharacterized protein n=1 Tax=Physcomitrium patens TaxID=3218 RepID=A0A2K1KGV2_PHYPA|nr:hypothetical protein PHYPA_009385 [Physcomitrium patens]
MNESDHTGCARTRRACHKKPASKGSETGIVKNVRLINLFGIDVKLEYKNILKIMKDIKFLNSFDNNIKLE